MRRLVVLGALLTVGLLLVAGCSSSTTTTVGVAPTVTGTQPPATLRSGTTLGSTGSSLQGAVQSTVSSLQGAVSEAVLESSGYTANCSGCHGAKGEGGPSGPAMSTYKDTSIVGLTSAIRNGVGEMPGFKDALSEGQVAALVGMIKSGFGLSGTTTSS